MKLVQFALCLLYTTFSFSGDLARMVNKSGWDLPCGIRPDIKLSSKKDDLGIVSIEFKCPQNKVIQIEIYLVEYDAANKPIIVVTPKKWHIYKMHGYYYKNRIFAFSAFLVPSTVFITDEYEPETYLVTYFDEDGSGKFTVRKDNCWETTKIPAWLWKDEINKDAPTLIPDFSIIPNPANINH